MTEQEKQEIINELERRLDEKYMSTKHEDVQTALRKPREKWFRDEKGLPHYSVMSNAFGIGESWKVWETVRRLTCLICGKQYVRQLCDTPHAEDICEKLCKFVYDLKMEYKEREK